MPQCLNKVGDNSEKNFINEKNTGQVFSCEFCKVFNNIYFAEDLSNSCFCISINLQPSLI